MRVAGYEGTDHAHGGGHGSTAVDVARVMNTEKIPGYVKIIMAFFQALRDERRRIRRQ